MKNPVVRFLPNKVDIEVEEGASLLEVARRAGYVLQSECGGQGTCRSCIVRLVSGDVFLTGEPNLTAKEREEDYILACLARVTEDLVVEVPEDSEYSFSPDAIESERSPGERPGQEIQARGLVIDPAVKRISIVVPPPTMESNSSDFERVQTALEKTNIAGPYDAGVDLLRALSSALRRNNGLVDATLFLSNRLPEILKIETRGENVREVGLALDVGTTTLFARLIDLESGDVLAEASDFNAQISCGGDVIHRIIYASKAGGLEELRTLVLGTVAGLLKRLGEEAKSDRDSITAAVVAGNTTMQHLFLGLDPKTIREEPYVPTVTHFPILRAAGIGLDIFPQSPVFMAPSVASYVGGDVTAGLLAAGVHRSKKLTLYVDLGTNGEIALGNEDWLTACACSAGPAFEGTGVKCGMRALPGGIDQVKADHDTGKLTYRIIGGGIPKGICGSGLIDLLAELRATNRITARGKLNPDADPERIRKAGRRAEMLLVNGAATGGRGDIVITDADLDNLIRTKGAIFAGIQTLLKGVGLETAAIERVVIAGSFGKHLDIENAIRIGMLPDLPRDRFEYIGNGSLRGAGLTLLSRQLWDELHEIARRITYFELSSWPGYMDEFMAALFLPHTDGSLFPSVKSP